MSRNGYIHARETHIQSWSDGWRGVMWTGIAPFTETNHIFQNIGDGTYYHSGILAIRSAIASKANITFKILVNDAIAMTGGQEISGKVRS